MTSVLRLRILDAQTDMQREVDIRHTGKGWPCDWGDTSESQGMPKIASNHQKLEEASKDSPLELPKPTWVCWHCV
jgi:hypothetical protein